MTVPGWRSISAMAGVTGFVGVKIAVGVLVTIATARWLSPGDFAAYTQLLLFAAWLALISTGGTVNGLVRQLSHHRDDPAARQSALSAAVLIWAAIAVTTIVLGLLLQSWISVFLLGTPDAAWCVAVLVPLSALTGLNQIMCGVLTGKGRIAESLVIQAFGLTISAAGTVWFVLAGKPAEGVIAFAGGAAIMLPLTLLRIRPRLSRHLDDLRVQARILMAHSAALFVVSTLPPLFLFAARSIYQEHFSIAALALWLLASRISDVNTQLVGLYGAQVALPAFTVAHARSGANAIWRRCALVAIALSLPAFLGFVAVGVPIMNLFLPTEYVAAAPFIAAYLLGDIFRSIVFMGMMWFLSQNRYIAYAVIEPCVIGLISVAVVLSAVAGSKFGPALAYPGIYALAAALVAAWHLRAWWAERTLVTLPRDASCITAEGGAMSPRNSGPPGSAL